MSHFGSAIASLTVKRRKPGVLLGTMNTVVPSCIGTSGLLRVLTKNSLPTLPLAMKVFSASVSGQPVG